MKKTFAIGIGGAAGQGVATPGDIFAKIFSRRGLHLNAYNACQSIIRGGHTFLTIRTGPEKVTNMGDRVDLLIPLNQDAMDRHLRLLTAGGGSRWAVQEKRRSRGVGKHWDRAGRL
jgi:2-oxoglutarate/2-oxoacid ferredoxin oxidoreductase subunit alpha